MQFLRQFLKHDVNIRDRKLENFRKLEFCFWGSRNRLENFSNLLKRLSCVMSQNIFCRKSSAQKENKKCDVPQLIPRLPMTILP